MQRLHAHGDAVLGTAIYGGFYWVMSRKEGQPEINLSVGPDLARRLGVSLLQFADSVDPLG